MLSMGQLSSKKSAHRTIVVSDHPDRPIHIELEGKTELQTLTSTVTFLCLQSL